MSEQQQARWGIRVRACREQGLPAATARQTLFFIFTFHHLSHCTEGTHCLFNLMRLRDRCVAEPLKAGTMQAFLNIWDRNMLEPTASAVSQLDLERLFF